MTKRRFDRLIFAIPIIFIGLVMRIVWSRTQISNPGSDDVLFAMMADAIRSGQDFPLLVWRAGYDGTLGMSWVLAVLFNLAGSSFDLAIFYGASLAIIQTLVWFFIAEKIRPGCGLWVVLLLAIAPPHVIAMTQVLGYAECLVVSSLLVWVIVRFSKEGPLSGLRSLILWLIAGYLLYTSSVGYVFVASLIALWRFRIKFVKRYAILGFAIGLLPLIIANLYLGGVTFRRVASRVLNMNASEFHQSSLGGLLQHFAGQKFFAIIQQPRLALELLSSGLAVNLLGLIVMLGFFFLIYRARRSPAIARWVAWPVILATLFGNIIVGTNARSRYLLPAYISGSLLGGIGASVGPLPVQAIAYSIAALNICQFGQYVRKEHKPVPYDALIEKLQANKMRYGYADYWTALPITFLSRGTLVVASTATDAMQIHDKTIHLTKQADEAEEFFYVFRTDRLDEKPYIASIEHLIRSGQLRAMREDVFPFRIYWNFDRPIRPVEIESVRQGLPLDT